MFGRKESNAPKKSSKLEDVANFIERKRLERLEKSKQREAKVREMKMQKVKSLQNLRSDFKPMLSKPTKESKKNSRPPPPVRQTLTSKKRIDIVNLNLPEYEEIRKIVRAKSANETHETINSTEPISSFIDISTDNKYNATNKALINNFPINENNMTNKPSTKRLNNTECVNNRMSMPKPSTSIVHNSAQHNAKENILKNQNTLTRENKTGAIPKQIITKPIVDKNIFNLNKPKTKSRKLWGSPKPINIDSIQNLQASSSEVVDDIPINNCVKVRSTLRRSISSIHRKKMNVEEIKKCIRRSQSLRALSTPIRSIIEEKPAENVSETPKGKISTPKPSDLQKRLIKWLQSHGKPVDNFKNIHMFGVNKSNKSQDFKHNKENIPIVKEDIQGLGVGKLDETYEKLPEEGIVQSTPKIDDLRMIEEVLKDLYNLIIDGYPKEQCEQWLKMIKHQCKSLQGLPIYWECKAILQSNEGDFQSAIESYQTAVTEGAEVVNIEDKLSNLYDRMCDLNIDPKSINAPAVENLALKQSEDSRDAFASSIIKFAVRQKPKLKKFEAVEEVYFATPVRRSSRLWAKTPLSVTPYQTPNQSIQYCSTLNSLDDKVRQSIHFTPNSALDTP